MSRRSSTGKPQRFTKATLPQKICAACARPFAWRKKWARDWDNVRYCSDRCRGQGAAGKAPDTSG